MPVDKERLRALAERINKTSNADFVKRLRDRNRKVIKNADGTVSTHELGYVTEDNGAVVFPNVQSIGDSLVRFPYPQSYERAVERGDTVHMSVPDAELFTTEYKSVYPGFNKYDMGGDKDGDVSYKQLVDTYNASVKTLDEAEKTAESAKNAYWDYYDSISRDYLNPKYRKKHLELLDAKDKAFEELDKARTQKTVAARAIGSATLDKYAGTLNDPMKYSRWASTDEEARKFLVDRAIRESAGAQEVADYFNSYANSAGIDRIISNQAKWGKKRHPYRRIYNPTNYGESGFTYSARNLRDTMREKGVQTKGVFDVDLKEGSGFNYWNYEDPLHIIINSTGPESLLFDEDFPYDFELAHEMLHDWNVVRDGQGEALQMNTNTKEGHDSRLDEKHSDLEALRYMLFKEGIYDSRGEKDATSEDIKKLREKYPKLRPLLQMDDEQAAWMINHVADVNKNVDMSNVAANGGLLHKFDGGGKFMTVSSGYAPLMYTPSPEIRPDVPIPTKYVPQPDNGDYEYTSSTGMLQDYPITTSVTSSPRGFVIADEVPGAAAQAVYNDEANKAAREERMWRQWYAESAFNNSAKSHAGAQGAFQIMPITYKDYLERGKGKPGDLNNPAYNRKVRDFVLGIIPRDLGAFWSDDSSDEINLAKRYAAYNWGAGSLRNYLRKKQKEGVDIHNSLAWLSGLPKETRDYVNFIVFNQDIPDTSKTQALYEAARKKYNGKSMGGVIEKLSKMYGNDRAAMLSALRKNRY